MNILSIDTSTKNFSLALAKDGQVVRYRNMVLDKVLESSMIPAIEKILNDAKLTFAQLDGYAVGLGPGSFTSLRVGLSTVKAFALTTGKPLVGIPSLDVMAMNAMQDKAESICTIMDARRQKIYACLYEMRGGLPVRKIDYLLTNIDELLKNVHGKTVFIGDAVPLCRQTITETSRKTKAFQPVFSSEKNALPQARKLSDLAYRRFIKKEYDDVDRLLPLYLYAQDCQVDLSPKK